MQLPWRTAWRFLPKLNLEPSHDPARPLLGAKARTRPERRPLVVKTAPFATAKRGKQPRCPPTGDWVNRVWSVSVEYEPALNGRGL